MKKFGSKLKKYFPKWTLIPLGICALSIVIHIICALSSGFADFFNSYIAGGVRIVLAKITGIFPNSLGELVVMLVPFAIIGLIAYAIYQMRHDGYEKLMRFYACVFSCLTLFYSVFVFTLGMGYKGTSLSEKLDLERKELSKDDLVTVTNYLIKEINALAPEMTFIKDSSSVMPFTFRELNEELNKTYKKTAEDYSFIMGYSSNIKPIMNSKLLSKAGLLGMYSYYTGETNVNVDYMDYILVYTCAHEMSHQRGISREDEANFMAFLVCLESENAYINYSGYVNMLEYMLNPLYSALKAEGKTSEYSRILSKLDKRVLKEIGKSSDKSNENEGTVSNIAGAVNDAFIKVNGDKNGTASYGLVVELTVAYFKNEGVLH